jgi:hypothetical protein
MKPKSVMKAMDERAVSKVIASPADVISEGHTTGGNAYCAEGSC